MPDYPCYYGFRSIATAASAAGGAGGAAAGALSGLYNGNLTVPAACT